MTGRKSIIYKLKVPAEDNKFYSVYVQANKHLGICDLTIYNPTTKSVHRLNEVLTDFQGRQANSEYVLEHLANVLIEKLNRHEIEF